MKKQIVFELPSKKLKSIVSIFSVEQKYYIEFNLDVEYFSFYQMDYLQKLCAFIESLLKEEIYQDTLTFYFYITKEKLDYFLELIQDIENVNLLFCLSKEGKP